MNTLAPLSLSVSAKHCKIESESLVEANDTNIFKSDMLSDEFFTAEDVCITNHGEKFQSSEKLDPKSIKVIGSNKCQKSLRQSAVELYGKSFSSKETSKEYDSTSNNNSENNDDESLVYITKNANLIDVKSKSNKCHSTVKSKNETKTKNTSKLDCLQKRESGGKLYSHNLYVGNDDDDETEYDYGNEEDHVSQSEDHHHYKRRNSFVINKDQNIFDALADMDPMLSLGRYTANDEPPRMSDKDLKYDQECKAQYFIDMYNQ